MKRRSVLAMGQLKWWDNLSGEMSDEHTPTPHDICLLLRSHIWAVGWSSFIPELRTWDQKIRSPATVQHHESTLDLDRAVYCRQLPRHQEHLSSLLSPSQQLSWAKASCRDTPVWILLRCSQRRKVYLGDAENARSIWYVLYYRRKFFHTWLMRR